MAWINFFGDKVRIKDIFLRNGKCLADVFYPVGSIYISAASTSPADMFGGTWKKLEGRFLLGASSAYPVGSTGGEATHTLTLSEMPSHSHGIRSNSTGGNADWVVSDHQSNKFQRELNFNWEGSVISKTGGGQPHNNMPPYVSVNMWQRTA